MTSAIGPGARRTILLLPFGYFVACLVLATALAGLNFWLGSLNLLPGESLWLPALLLILLYGWKLDQHLKQTGLASPQYTKPRRLMVAVSTLLSAPVLGLLVAPALNGLGGLEQEKAHLAAVVRIESTHVRRSTQLYYYAYISDNADLPPGRYFMGRYDQAWEPEDANMPLSDIHQVLIRYRRGLLGAHTLLEVTPVPYQFRGTSHPLNRTQAAKD